MAFIAFPNTPSLPFPINGKGDPNMMQRYAAISSSLGERKIMHHFVVHPVHFHAAMPLERVVRHITASVQFDSKSSSNTAIVG
jgi:hypothetical protein